MNVMVKKLFFSIHLQFSLRDLSASSFPAIAVCSGIQTDFTKKFVCKEVSESKSYLEDKGVLGQ